MILHINSSEYDYHTLVKVAEMAGLAGLVGFHESEDGYIPCGDCTSCATNGTSAVTLRVSIMWLLSTRRSP